MNKKPSLFRNLFKSVSAQDKINLARHLSIVVKAGLPILEGLKMIKKQTGSKYLGFILDKVAVDVSNGQFLATSLANYPDVFDGFFINIVRVGETSGTLATNLAYLADELKKSHDIRNKIRSAMIYPVIIMIATAALTSFLVFFAFPKILPILVGLRVQLPLSTLILMAVSEFLIANGPYVLFGIVVVFVAGKILLTLEPVRIITGRIALLTPIISELSVNMNAANFSRVLAVLLRGGIKIVEALVITAQTFDNLVYRNALFAAAERAKKGEQLAQFLETDKRIFPALLTGLVGIGENTGNLEDNLSYLADYYREETELKIRNLTVLIEPLLLLVMGLIVGFVAISIITPIYSISSGVAK